MSSPDGKGEEAYASEVSKRTAAGGKLGTVSGVYIPVVLNIVSILMFLRFGLILGQVGFIGILGLLLAAYCICFLTLFSLSAIASNGEVKGGGPYYLISRSLGPEFGGSIGLLFYIAQTLNATLNVVGLIDCIRLNFGPAFPSSYWAKYAIQTGGLVATTALCLLNSTTFAKASNACLVILTISVVSIPISAIFREPFHDHELGIHFTGIRVETLADNFLPHFDGDGYTGFSTFRDLFGILFPASAGILAGASMSSELREPSKAIPSGTLWATLTTFIVYFIVILSMAASTTKASLLANANVVTLTSVSQPIIFAGQCAVTAFSALMGIKSSTGLFRALARDKLLPGLAFFDKGVGRRDMPIFALLLTYAIAQVALLAELDGIATLISMGFHMTFFVMNLACFFLKVASVPNFRPSFKFFSWQTALLGSLLSAAAMFFIDETYASLAICILIALFLLIHYLCPPKRWGDVSQNLIYHQVRKYLLRLKPEHIKFWRPHIILLINNPRSQTRLIQFCNSLKKGSLYILGHVIVTDDFSTGVDEARLQQQAWSNYISESSRLKAFVQLTMSPSLTWGVRNLILAAGLGGMRPNIAVIGFYNMNDLRNSNPSYPVPEIPTSITDKMKRPSKAQGKRVVYRRRGDTSARLLEGTLPTDIIRTEGMMLPTEYMTILEDLALRYRLNVAVGYGFNALETPRKDGTNTKKYVDLWPIQMSAEITSDGKNVLTTNFDTYTLILQLGHILRSVNTWRQAYKIRVMVFVEFEYEVAEETARVRALLEKLRIEATVVVFWLASGQLNTYELIINGGCDDIEWEIVVNDALRDEAWWDDLQMFRGRYDHMSASQERSQLAHILDSTAGRPGVYNPHEEGSSPAAERRRSEMSHLAELHRSTKANLARVGVHVGMHTQHLNEGILNESSSDDDDEDDGTDADKESVIEGPISPIEEDPGDEARREFMDTVNRPLLLDQRRGSTPRTEGSSVQDLTPRPGRGWKARLTPTDSQVPTYGTMSSSQTLMDLGQRQQSPRPMDYGSGYRHITRLESTEEDVDRTPFPSFTPGGGEETPVMPTRRDRSPSPTKRQQQQQQNFYESDAMASGRPSISRQSSTMRFTSRLVPEATITAEGDISTIRFSDTTPAPSRPGSPRLPFERPAASRQSSFGYGKFSSRPVPEAKVTDAGDGQRTIKFADEQHQQHQQHSPAHSRHHSRQQSRQHSRRSSLMDQGTNTSPSTPGLSHSQKGDDANSAYSAIPAIELSFNELPSRAQHLILNELMRQHSGDTAVLLSTLPVPPEGSSLDEGATIQYLSDVEVLCNELPPTLLVLSNNMTVTVSL